MISIKSILIKLIKDKLSLREFKPELSKYNVQESETGENDTSEGGRFFK